MKKLSKYRPYIAYEKHIWKHDPTYCHSVYYADENETSEKMKELTEKLNDRYEKVFLPF